MKVSRAPVLGSLSIDDFLKTYWQKKPLVVRGAFPDLRDPLTPDELAGLACEAGVDSRLIVERGGAKPWQVTRGPLRPGRLRKLPPSHWTLLVESVDRHSDEVAALASAFSFLPDWRMDDVMVSLSPKKGGVGAHIDSYDVFLVQGQGRRRWEVDTGAHPDYKPGLDLRILKRFRAEESWELDPGDLLYVPPGVGHRGTTLESPSDIAITYSVGFRAPSSADLLSSLMARTLTLEPPRLFSDPARSGVRDPGELGSADLAHLKNFLIAEVKGASPDFWTLCAGEAVTSGGGSPGFAGNVRPASVARRLAAGRMTVPVPGARMSWAALERGRAALFVNGESRVLARSQAFAASALCGNGSAGLARRLSSDAVLVSLTVDLLRAGVVGWPEES